MVQLIGSLILFYGAGYVVAWVWVEKSDNVMARALRANLDSIMGTLFCLAWPATVFGLVVGVLSHFARDASDRSYNLVARHRTQKEWEQNPDSSDG